MAIICPLCGAESHVLESRVLEDFWMRRRRNCVTCNYRWTTLEVLIDAVDLIELKHQQQGKETLQREARKRREKIKLLGSSNADDENLEASKFETTESNLLKINTEDLKTLLNGK